MLYRGIGKMRESLHVYLGGREVYSFNENNPDWEYFVGGYWQEVILELQKYEIAVWAGETYNVNGTLLRLCTMEAKRNREILNKYFELCVRLVEKRGNVRINSGKKCIYECKVFSDRHTIELLLEKRVPDARVDYEDKIKLYFDGEVVFCFYWHCSAVGSRFDEKGKYIPGEWECLLEKLDKEC